MLYRLPITLKLVLRVFLKRRYLGNLTKDKISCESPENAPVFWRFAEIACRSVVFSTSSRRFLSAIGAVFVAKLQFFVTLKKGSKTPLGPLDTTDLPRYPLFHGYQTQSQVGSIAEIVRVKQQTGEFMQR